MRKYLNVLLIFIAGCSSPMKTQKAAEQQAAIRSAIDQKKYVFIAQSMQPASGRARQLTTYYSVTINRDSLVSDLPYFGRAYQAPMDVTKSVLSFSSIKFDYTVSPGKKGGWNINIRFHDVSEVQGYSLSISPTGYASLQALPTNQQAISFNGMVDQKK